MRIIALSTLKLFWEENPKYIDAKNPTLSWYQFALKADWSTPAEVKQDFGNASILKDGRVVFNIAGNKYRLVVDQLHLSSHLYSLCRHLIWHGG